MARLSSIFFTRSRFDEYVYAAAQFTRPWVYNTDISSRPHIGRPGDDDRFQKADSGRLVLIDQIWIEAAMRKLVVCVRQITKADNEPLARS